MRSLPPGFHKEGGVRDAEAEMAGPFRCDARVGVQHGKNGCHLKAKQVAVLLMVFWGMLTSRYIVAQPSRVIDRKIGLATLNTFNFLCLNT